MLGIIEKYVNIIAFYVFGSSEKFRAIPNGIDNGSQQERQIYKATGSIPRFYLLLY